MGRSALLGAVLLFAVGGGGCTDHKAQECMKDRSTFSVDWTCMKTSDCCDGWSCIAGERTDGLSNCNLPCTSNSDCTGVCCPAGATRGLGTCDADPPCYFDNPQNHCSGITDTTGHLIYGELCPSA